MSDRFLTEDAPSRGELLRDLLTFQVKLWIEGFKDVILVPLSLVAALFDVLFDRRTLYGVMRRGDQFERWIDLYGALDATGKKCPEKEASLASGEAPAHQVHSQPDAHVGGDESTGCLENRSENDADANRDEHVC